MVLKSLEIQGFKSFPDRTSLNFGKGITAVVGPNGSGKSNISDAVRWVLGETSSKSLRGSKMEDVIFSGTSTRKALGFAQVQLTLDNTDQTLKDKGEIVTVSRRYYRSGESEYKIDGETVRARDIRELFMDTGLGSDGYSMVGQGKIDSIISQKNEDRRELFEEAAGISLFRHKRKDATRRLDQAQENLVRLLDILGELESRVEPLRKQSEKAQKFITLSDEKKILEIGVWVNKINRFTNELREQEHKIDAANASYDICEKELKAIEEEIEEIAQKTVSINTQIEQIRMGSKAYEEEALRKDGEASVLETTLNHNNETIERLKNDIGDVDNTNLSIDAQIEEKQNFISESEVEIEAKKQELKNVTDEMNNLLSSNSAIRSLALSFSLIRSESWDERCSYFSKTSLCSPCALISSSFACCKSACAPCKLASAKFASSSAVLYLALICCAVSSSFLASLLSSSIIFPLERIPAPFDCEPPVIEPPGFIIWPSTVTILNLLEYLFEIPIAESISSTITTLPKRFEIIFLYSFLQSTSSLAIATKPKLSSRSFSSRFLGFIAEIGRKVALPTRLFLR